MQRLSSSVVVQKKTRKSNTTRRYHSLMPIQVVRDRIMDDADQAYPQYGFRQHKGYPTAQHIAALQEHGPCPLHRRSYRPVMAALEARAA